MKQPSSCSASEMSQPLAGPGSLSPSSRRLGTRRENLQETHSAWGTGRAWRRAQGAFPKSSASGGTVSRAPLGREGQTRSQGHSPPAGSEVIAAWAGCLRVGEAEKSNILPSSLSRSLCLPGCYRSGPRPLQLASSWPAFQRNAMDEGG